MLGLHISIWLRPTGIGAAIETFYILAETTDVLATEGADRLITE